MGVQCSACRSPRSRQDNPGVEEASKIVDHAVMEVPKSVQVVVVAEPPVPVSDEKRPSKETARPADKMVSPQNQQLDVGPSPSQRPSRKAVKPPLTRKEQMMEVMAIREGFFAALDQSVSGGSNTALYGIKEEDSDDVVQEKVHNFRKRIMTHPNFNSSRVIGCVITEKSLDAKIEDTPFSIYLWGEKQMIPILRADTGLQPEKNGVQLMKANMMMLDVLLNKASKKEVCGVKVRSVIRLPNAVGIKSCIDQLLQVSQRIIDKDLVPIIQPEIDIKSPDKAKCESVLIDVLIDAFDRLDRDIKVGLVLTIPTNPNLYLPLTRHSNVLRVTALSGGYDRPTACKMLEQNVGMCANFARALSEDLYAEQEEEEFGAKLDIACKEIFQASHGQDETVEKLVRLSDQAGFIVALTPRAMRPMMSEEDLQAGEEILGDSVLRIITNPKFNSSRVISAIMSMNFASLEIEGLSAAQFVWKVKGVVPFTILSYALEAEANAVQLMAKPPNWEDMLDQAAYLGIFGVQLRGLVKGPNKKGIDSLVKQHFEIGKMMMQKGLLPNMLLEVDMHSENKAQCEEMLLNAILVELGNLTQEQKVSLVLTVPTKPNLYLQLIEHPNTVRVGAPSQGYKCLDACRMLSENNGMIGIFGRAFTERLKWEQTDEEFTAILADTCKVIHEATVAVSAKEEQMIKVSSQDGCVAILDSNGSAATKQLKRYGIDTDKCTTEKSVNAKMHQMITRIVTNDNFNGSRVIATVLNEVTMEFTICGMPSAKYLWSQKGTVPFLKVDNGLKDEADGVQLMKYDVGDVARLMNLLDRAAAAGIFGTKQRSFIRLPNEAGIKAVIDQQVEMGRHVCARGLLPILQPEVDIHSPQKALVEQILLDALLDAVERLRSDEKVVLLLTLPDKPNLYLPLMGHPNVVRLIALSGGYSRKDACKMLRQNVNMIAGFGRAFVEGLSIKQKEAEFSKAMDQSCNTAFNASKSLSNRDEQNIKLSSQNGFIVGFDQDVNSMPSLLKNYGITESEFADETAMMEKAHQLHTRIIKNPQFNGSRCIGVILPEYAIAMNINRLPPAKYLWDLMRILSFMKLDKGLAPEKDGVRHMKEIHDINALLDKASRAGMFGTITRSVVRLPNPPAIRGVVNQQVEYAKQIMLKGLVPILQMEVDINSPDKNKCERLLMNAIMRGLEDLNEEQKVILDLTLPNAPGTYSQLLKHSNVIRVAALSGGYSREAACKMLQENVGMIASFGRAFAEGFHVTQTEKEFTAQIVQSCNLLYHASSVRVADKEKENYNSSHDAVSDTQSVTQFNSVPSETGENSAMMGA